MTGRSFDERDIHLALDDELPEDERAAFEEWLAGHPNMEALAERLAADRDLLRGALVPIAQEPLPARFADFAKGEGRDGKRRHMPWLRLAAAAVLLAAGGIGGYVYASWPVGEQTREIVQVADDALAAHLIYAAEKLHVVEVDATQKDHLVGWLSKRVGTKLMAPDLGPQGFQLVGGRLLPSGRVPAAQFMYEGTTGERVSLYVTHCTHGTETGFRLFEMEDARAFYWLEEGFGYAVAGGVSEDELLAIANTAYRQLLEVQGGGG